MSIYIGGGLIILGALLLLIGRHHSRRSSVAASRGSIAIGGNAYGPVSNVNAAPDKGHGIGEHWITIVAIITELAGIAVIIWHTTHMVAK